MVKSVLFVCLGNICRSPTAEGIFRSKIKTKGFKILHDSAGLTNWHQGQSPYEPMQNTCEKHQIASTLIANKRDIDLFARGKKDVKFLCGWRFKIFGKLVQ